MKANRQSKETEKDGNNEDQVQEKFELQQGSYEKLIQGVRKSKSEKRHNEYCSCKEKIMTQAYLFIAS